MDGERLYKYLKNKGLSQKEMLIKCEFSANKLYGIFKQGTIKATDRGVLIKNFELPPDFFENANYTGGEPAAAGNVSIRWIYDNHCTYLQRLKITGRYSFYSWKHTGVVKCVQAGLNIRDIQNQLRHHSLDMVHIYLQNLGVLQSEDLKKKYPVL